MPVVTDERPEIVNELREPFQTVPNKSTIAILVGLAFLAAACTSKSAEPVSNSTGSTLQNEAPKQASANTLSPEQKRQRTLAEDYIKSEERNSIIGEAVQAAGEKIVHAAESGDYGKFTFINNRTGEYGLGEDNEGWGKLHHNPIDGGQQITISMTVYQMKNGQIDLNKGIQELKIGSTAGPSYLHFESPEFSRVILDEAKDEDAWQVARTPGRIGSMLGETKISNELECMKTSAASLREIDQNSIHDLSSIMVQSELQKAA